ncbi:transglycosylase domain-containing protein [Candidatus Thioglobus sp.]|nr:transglycosylase domain-containing protein [Candidatus Thioglobus sp.]MDC0920148.1 transglycosylase domain-containing protein [Candidatus Thioglobus sp.]
MYLNNLVNDHFSNFNKADEISYEQQSRVAINMLLLTEDQSFFEHSGVDFQEIARVLRDYWMYDKPLRGASTLTQQLIKNSLLTREQTIERKLKEGLMAILLEVSFDKEFILNRYMNSVYLGQKGSQPVYGFRDAAQFYFNKKIALLSPEEIATLVALVKGPSYYHPVKHPQRLAKRRELVLHLYNKYKKIVK